jgi:hypothetical protein
MTYKEVREFEESTQVILRLQTMLDSLPPGHRVFLRTLKERLSDLADGKIDAKQLFLGGWLMGGEKA